MNIETLIEKMNAGEYIDDSLKIFKSLINNYEIVWNDLSFHKKIWEHKKVTLNNKQKNIGLNIYYCEILKDQHKPNDNIFYLIYGKLGNTLEYKFTL